MFRAHLKAIVITAISLLTVISFVLFISFSTLLSSIGLAVVDVKRLGTLHAAEKTLNQAIKRNRVKRSAAHTRFVKRAGKKVLLGSVAALSVGTVAVAFTTIGLEVEDYCDYVEDLEKERAFLERQAAHFDRATCLETAKSDLSEVATHASSEGKQMILEALDLN